MKITELLKEMIVNKAFIKLKETWLFDFRKVSLTPNFSEVFSRSFFETFDNTSEYQLCGLETASIALISTIVSFSKINGANINGLYIRKSRKKYDLVQDIEGEPNGKPIILIDDILNKGASIKRQIEVLKKAGHKVVKVFVILRFRDLDYYKWLEEEGIQLISLFELNDFKEDLGVENITTKIPKPPVEPEVVWKKKYSDTHFGHIQPKSAPILANNKIYFGTDEGILFCIDIKNGDVVWEKKLKYGSPSGKYIFSTPVHCNSMIFFGGYDGNFYALNAETGEEVWTYKQADWISSSPAISVKNNLVYVGLQFGLYESHGGIVALNTETGKEIWNDGHPSLTPCSPFVSEKYNLLLCGSNDGILRVYNSKSGEKIKEVKLKGEIKAGFSENENCQFIAFGTFAGKVYVFDNLKLEIIKTFDTLDVIYSTPVWNKQNVIVTCLDKRIYSFNTETDKKNWEFDTNGRIFSDPVIIGESVIFGNNSGFVYKLNIESGVAEGIVVLAERVVNKVLYIPQSNQLIIPTIDNEIFCINFTF